MCFLYKLDSAVHHTVNQNPQIAGKVISVLNDFDHIAFMQLSKQLNITRLLPTTFSGTCDPCFERPERFLASLDSLSSSVPLSSSAAAPPLPSDGPPEPGGFQGPGGSPEPEALPEPEGAPEPEALSEPDGVPVPDALPEPDGAPELGDFAESDFLSDPDGLPVPLSDGLLPPSITP